MYIGLSYDFIQVTVFVPCLPITLFIMVPTLFRPQIPAAIVDLLRFKKFDRIGQFVDSHPDPGQFKAHL